MEIIKGVLRRMLLALISTVIVLIVITVVLLINHAVSNKNKEKEVVNMTRCVMSAEICEKLTDVTVEEFVEYQLWFDFYDGSNPRTTEGVDGELVIFLNDSQLSSWRNESMSRIDKAEEVGADVASDLKSVTVSWSTAYEEIGIIDNAMRGCVYLQIMNGASTEDVYVDLIVVDEATGEEEFSFRFPEKMVTSVNKSGDKYYFEFEEDK
ncbi:MAG: hypothetical protein E7628_07315 [Ruminococcaceae bacterium]|nr:hypothetical protein [Oscillospiraceae bacterium]